MGKARYAALVALAVAVGLSGCNTVSDKLSEPGPSSGKVTKRETRINRDAPKGDSCELKNPYGTGECDDGRHATAKGKSASKKTNRPLVPGDCTAFGLAGYAKLAELGHRMEEWKAYCSAQQAAQTPAAARQRPVTDDGDRGGTWFCEDSADGSGNYGTYEMTLQTNRYYDCKKVD